MISKVEYGTFANYSPRGQSPLSLKSKGICHRFKNGDPDILSKFIASMGDTMGIFDAFFGQDVVLVPAPRSAPLVAGGLWPAKIIADALVEGGYGGRVLPCVQRRVAVPRSAGAANRPTVQIHYDSFSVSAELLPEQKITIVDDVLTRGCTTMAMAMRLHEAYPRAEIRVFAPIRTLGLIPEVSAIKDPSVGTITLAGGYANRDP